MKGRLPKFSMHALLNANIAATAIVAYVFYVWNWILPTRQRAPALMWIAVGGCLVAIWGFYFWLKRSSGK